MISISFVACLWIPPHDAIHLRILLCFGFVAVYAALNNYDKKIWKSKTTTVKQSDIHARPLPKEEKRRTSINITKYLQRNMLGTSSSFSTELGINQVLLNAGIPEYSVVSDEKKYKQVAYRAKEKVLPFINKGWGADQIIQGVRLSRKPSKKPNSLACIKMVGKIYGASPQVLSTLLEDQEFKKAVDHSVQVSELLGKVDKEIGVYYQRDALPWPFSPRDFVYVSCRFAIPDSKGALAVVQQGVKHPKRPPSSSCVRGSTFSCFLLEPVRYQQGAFIRLTIASELDPGGAIPHWLVNALITDYCITFEAMNRTLASDSGRKMIQRIRKNFA